MHLIQAGSMELRKLRALIWHHMPLPGLSVLQNRMIWNTSLQVYFWPVFAKITFVHKDYEVARNHPASNTRQSATHGGSLLSEVLICLYAWTG
jgi:hypothetical protein